MNTLQFKFLPNFLFCYLLSLFIQLPTYISQLEEAVAQNSKVELSHTPPKEDSLLLPGDMMELKVKTIGTRYVDLQLRLIAILDDKLIDISIPTGTVENDENAVYSVQLPTPISSLQYQFIGFDNSKKPLVSKWFNLKRTCSFDASKTQVDLQSVQNSDRVDELFILSSRLERELKAYKFSENILQEILMFIKNRKNPE